MMQMFCAQSVCWRRADICSEQKQRRAIRHAFCRQRSASAAPYVYAIAAAAVVFQLPLLPAHVCLNVAATSHACCRLTPRIVPHTIFHFHRQRRQSFF